jgi:uncharacterized protein (TIGR02391 family)
MSQQVNIQRIAVEVGDKIKWSSSINQIDRQGQAILKVSKENFPHNAITSQRQQAIYNWLCSIAKMDMLPDERNKLITEFCLSLAADDQRYEIVGILEAGGMPAFILFKDQLAILEREKLHPEVYKHAKGSFQHEKYAHAVLEVCKAYDKAVQQKSQLQKFGRSLMQEAWSWNSNTLRATTGTSDSDESFHEGLKLMSEGLMTGIRNVTAHEPILSWPIGKEDCIDLLHHLSFLYRQLVKSVNIKTIGGATATP